MRRHANTQWGNGIEAVGVATAGIRMLVDMQVEKLGAQIAMGF